MHELTPTTLDGIKHDLLERTRAFLAEERGVEPDAVRHDTRFRDDLDLDSLDLVELMTRFEEEYGDALDSVIESDAVLNLRTVGEAIDLAAQTLFDAQER